jgi:hypothetical protein
MVSAVAQRAKAHFVGIGLRSVDVPEWADPSRPLKVWFRPISMAEREKVRTQADDPADMVVRMVVLKALDENGERLFSIEDRMVLRTEADGDVISRIYNAMNAPAPAPADIEKN